MLWLWIHFNTTMTCVITVDTDYKVSFYTYVYLVYTFGEFTENEILQNCFLGHFAKPRVSL